MTVLEGATLSALDILGPVPGAGLGLVRYGSDLSLAATVAKPCNLAQNRVKLHVATWLMDVNGGGFM